MSIRNSLAVLAATTALAAFGGYAMAATGTTSDGHVTWTTSFFAPAPLPSAYAMDFGVSAGRPAPSAKGDTVGGTGTAQGYTNWYGTGPNTIYRPDGSADASSKLLTEGNSGTQPDLLIGQTAAALNTRTYFSALIYMTTAYPSASEILKIGDNLTGAAAGNLSSANLDLVANSTLIGTKRYSTYLTVVADPGYAISMLDFVPGPYMSVNIGEAYLSNDTVTLSSTAGGADVPEPSSMAAAMLAGVGLLGFSMKTRRS